MPIPTINAKLGRMRKATRWVIYPKQREGATVIQTDAYIAAIDLETGEGMLSKRCNGGAYFLHLSPALGAKPIKVPEDVLADIKANAPGPGPIRLIG